MKKVLTLGGAMRDVFIEYDTAHMLHMHDQAREQSFILLEEGRKIEVKHIAYHLGGGATNSAVSFRRLGFEVEAFFKLGGDQAGDYILLELGREHVATYNVVRDETQKTGVSFIIPCSSGNKVALVYRGANLTIKESELPWSAIETADQMYITSLSAASSQLLLPITAYAKKYNKPVAVNPGSSQLLLGAAVLRESLPNIDILILNSSEAQQFMVSLLEANSALQDKVFDTALKQEPIEQVPQLLQGPLNHKEVCFNFYQYFREILSRGPKIVVVTNGAEGVYVATDSTIYFLSSVPAKVVSTLGAGDAFGSCFVASLLQGKTVQQALMAGALNSASVIGHVGTQIGLLNEQELEDRLQKADMSLVQAFPLIS
ncbi:MAG: carbohydrate kinase family protein [Candidatus Dependentiae bacterium]|nr:carbohydrate kinase family protein [Candidatus Dependentiae bacterium]